MSGTCFPDAISNSLWMPEAQHRALTKSYITPRYCVADARST